MIVPFMLISALEGAVVGGAIGCIIPQIVKKTVSYKCRQRGRPEPQKSIPKWLRALCIFMMMILTALTAVSGSVIFSGVYRYKVFFTILFITIALVISLTDCYIHLIPNESILLLLGLGIIYRLVFDGLFGLLNALLALGITILIFGGSSAIFFLIKKCTGIGAGDLKYVFAISVIIGTSGIIPFLSGMAVAVLAYVFIVVGKHLLLMNDYFPMAAHLSCGFAVALLLPYIKAAQEITLLFP